MNPAATHPVVRRPRAIAPALLLALPLLLHASRVLAGMGMGDPPVIDFLTANPGTVTPGGQTTLTCVAHDPDGTINKYVWTAADGTFPGGGTTEETIHPANTIVWTAPAAAGDHDITCTVWDNDLFGGNSVFDTVTVTIDSNQAPSIDSVTPAKTILLPGEAVEIVCAATDPDGDPFTLAWMSSGGTVTGDADADPERVTWTAPVAGGTYTVTVTATDDKGAFSSDLVALVVRFAEHEASFAGALVKVPLRVAVAPWGEYFTTDKGRVIVFQADGTFVREIGGFNRPLALAISAEGELFVGEVGTGGIRAFDREGAFLRTVAPPGSLAFPSDMCLDGQGLLYVTDGKADCVKVYSVDGGEVDSFGSSGPGPGEFRFPTGIAYDPATDHVIVCDQMNKRLQIFDASGGHVSTIDNSGSLPVDFAFVQGLAVDPAGRIFVADSFQGHLGTVNEAGEWLGSVGSYGTAPGELRLPNDVALDPTGKLVVTSTSNGRIEVFKLLDVTGAYTDPPPTKGGGGLGDVTLPFGGGCGAPASGGGVATLALALAAAVLVRATRRKTGRVL